VIECPFVVGDEVVCIDSYMEGADGVVFDSMLTLGRIYTVSHVFTKTAFYHRIGRTEEHVVVVLQEVPVRTGGYHWARFKKVQKLDTSAFTKLLKTKVLEDA
jgi:hypothetical protein